MTKLIVLGALLLSGCAQHKSFAAFVVNQDAQSSSKPGKSYSAEPCTLTAGNGTLTLSSGLAGQPSSLQLRMNVPVEQKLPDSVGKTMSSVVGEVQLENSKLTLERGSLTLQTLDGGIARGNFNVRAQGGNPPWEVVGSFEAQVQ